MINNANSIVGRPYIWGGGHGSWYSYGYDCSGSVSFALFGGGLIPRPLTSGALEGWGAPGPGKWITVYANAGHTFAEIAGLRWDTVGDENGTGPRWHLATRLDRRLRRPPPARALGPSRSRLNIPERFRTLRRSPYRGGDNHTARRPMKFAIIYHPKVAGPGAASGSAESDGELDATVGGRLENVNFFVGGGGFGTIETDDAGELMKMISEHPFTIHSEVEIKPVVDPATAIGILQETSA